MWDAQIEALNQRFQVVRYDTRGHGNSPVTDGPYSIGDLADDLIGLLDRLDIERAHLVGLSLGGATAMHVAARRPERVESLAVLCTAAHFPPMRAWTDRAALVRQSGTGAVAEAVVERWFTERYRASQPASVRRYQAMVAETPAEGYAGCCDALAQLDLRAELSSIAATTLAIAGDNDPATPPAALEDIVGAIPMARLLVVQQAAHLANVEQPGVALSANLG